MSKHHLYIGLAAVLAGYVLAPSLASHRPFSDAYTLGHNQAH